MRETSGRLLRLLGLLQARRFWPGSDLASRLEVTERTVRRDIDRLRRLGYPIQASAGVAGGYQLGAGGRLPPLLLDDDEALAVALGLRTAAAGSVTGVEEAALRALSKLEPLLPKRLRGQVEAIHAAIAPLYGGRPLVSTDVLTALAGACREEARANFRYTDTSGRGSDRSVEPHGLVHTGARWYVVAWDLVREDWRTFRVDRIDGQVTSQGRFVPRPVPGGDLAAFVSRSVAFSAHPDSARVIFHAPYERIRAKVPPLAGHLTPVDHGRCRLETGAGSLGTMALHLALIEEEFEVEQPHELVERIRELAERLGRVAERSRRQPPHPREPT